MEQPVAQPPQKLVQFGSGGVDQLGSGSAEHDPAEPEGQPGDDGGRQGAAEAQEAGGAEQNLLLSVRHDGWTDGWVGGGGVQIRLLWVGGTPSGPKHPNRTTVNNSAHDYPVGTDGPSELELDRVR